MKEIKNIAQLTLPSFIIVFTMFSDDDQ